MDRTIIEYIKDKWDCPTYARLVLGLPIYKAGDRCKSFRPDAQRNDSLLVNQDSWCDFGADLHGDVIDLCAHALHNGDKGAAIRDLAGDKFSSGFVHRKWKNYTDRLEDKIRSWHKALRPEDIEYLHSRKITDATIKRLMLGYSHNEKRLIIPYYKNGHIVYWAGRDRTGEKGASKYKKMFIDAYNEHCPWGLHSVDRKSDCLIVAEGAFDAMSFEQEGYPVLSPIGGYFSKSQTSIFLTIAQNFKYVFICFDSDKPGMSFQKRMSEICFSHRIKFRCGHLPEGIKDISDFYVAGGNLKALILNAEEGIASLAKNYDDKDEFALFLRKAARFIPKYDIADAVVHAKQFGSEWRKALLAECTKAPAETLVVDDVCKKFELKYIENAGFFKYSHGVWTLTPDNMIKNIIADSLGLYATGNRLASVLSFVKARKSSLEEFNRQNVFNFLNGVLDLETGKMLQHSPSFMSSIQCDFDYDPKADCPNFKRFVYDVMQGNPYKIALLQEMAGYPLYADNSLQKCFFLMGDGSNGKSVLLNTLAAVFGRDNCSYVDISGLVAPFDPIRLRYSLVNFSNETRSNIKEADEKFKAVIAGDPISAAYKGKDAIEFQSRAKWICAANNYISASDVNYSMMRRIIFIRFERTFKGADVDPDLTQKLIEEKQGIFNWLYFGYQRLKETKRFTDTDEQVELVSDFMSAINPVASFVEEKLFKKVDEVISTSEMYILYCDWCKSGGFKPSNRNNFTRTVKAIIKQKRPDVTFKRSAEGYYFAFGCPD